MTSEPTFNNSETSVESVRVKFRSRLKTIFYSELTVENIENFASVALEDLLTLNEEILKEYRENMELNPLANVSTREQEDDAYKKLELPNIQEILEEILKVGDKIKKLKKELEDNLVQTNKVITPTESRPLPVGDGGIERIFLPRLLTLAYILSNDFGLSMDSFRIIKGIVTPDMFRQEPYYRVDVPDLERVVYVCDEHSNATYVFDSEKIVENNLDIERIDTDNKTQKKELMEKYPGIGVRIVQSPNWRRNMSSVLNGSLPVVENDYSVSSAEPISEFKLKKERGNWLPFDKFKEETRSLYPGFGSRNKWYLKEYKKHSNWHSLPHDFYSDEWNGWKDLLPENKRWPKFDVFQEEVKKSYKGEEGVYDWYQEERKKHLNWPSTPYKIYENIGWKSWPDLVGKEGDNFLEFNDFKKEVQSLYDNQRPVSKWYTAIKGNHLNWPGRPNVFYEKEGWDGWESLVGLKKTRNIERISFEDFKKEVSYFYNGESNVASWYKKESRKHPNWPTNPSQNYGDSGWEGFPHLVNIESRIKNWLTFENFKKDVLSFYDGRKNIWEWYTEECKKHPNWPTDPKYVYEDSGWEGFPELVDRENVRKKVYLPFEEFKKEVREIYPGGPIQDWFRKEYKKHPNWPSNPHRTYKNKGWVNYEVLVV